MEINPIQGIEVTGAEFGITSIQTAPTSFGDYLLQGLEQVNQDINKATELSDRYAIGEAIPTDELMIALEQAQLSLKLAVEVKNKLTSAYQELFRMQV